MPTTLDPKAIADRRRRRESILLARGKCVGCGRNPIETARSNRMCISCLDGTAIVSNKRKHDRIARGVCIVCEAPPVTGKRKCQPCQDKANAAARKWYDAHGPQYHKDYKRRLRSKTK